jgi:hypothetical protein
MIIRNDNEESAEESGSSYYDSESDEGSDFLASDAGDSEISDNIAARSYRTYKTNKTFKTNMTGKTGKSRKSRKAKKANKNGKV